MIDLQTLERIKRGSRLSSLRLRLQGAQEGSDGIFVKLVDLRRDRGLEKRVVIVAAPLEPLRASVFSAFEQRDSLFANDLLIVPLVIVAEGPGVAYSLRSPPAETVLPEGVPPSASASFLASAAGVDQWNDALKNELAAALKQTPEALAKGVTIIVKKNGKVGTRRFGVPLWEQLVDEVESRRSRGLDVNNI